MSFTYKVPCVRITEGKQKSTKECGKHNLICNKCGKYDKYFVESKLKPSIESGVANVSYYTNLSIHNEKKKWKNKLL